MAIYFERRIIGVPYSQNKVKGDVEGCLRWSQAIINATRDFPALQPPYNVTITFILPESKYPKDHPFGSDLDNLTKRLFDALSRTVFSKAPGKDGSVVKMSVSKRQVRNDELPGAVVKIVEC
jgi:Holliday junction resolvase RusA-like endonuclease